jgi:hypothetical protein
MMVLPSVAMVLWRANAAMEVVLLASEVPQQVLARVHRPWSVVMVSVEANALMAIVPSPTLQQVLALLKPWRVDPEVVLHWSL